MREHRGAWAYKLSGTMTACTGPAQTQVRHDPNMEEGKWMKSPPPDKEV